MLPAQTKEFNSQNEYLEELAELAQWCYWLPRPRPGERPAKEPRSPRTGRCAKVNAPATWGTWEEATAQAAACEGSGVGFLFTAQDSYCGVDLDDCRDPHTGELASWARRIVAQLDSYTEVSPSGTGLHIILRGTLPAGTRHEASIQGGKIEVYDRVHYFTVTGDVLRPAPIRDRQRALDALCEEFLGAGAPDEATSAPTHIPASSLRDDEILHKACRARNGEKFIRLFDRGEATGYKSGSEAHLALVSLLAFWTQDEAQLERLFSSSAFGDADKWQRPDYRTRTIQRALKTLTKTYTPRQAAPSVQAQLQALDAAAAEQPWAGRRQARNYYLLRAFITTGGESGSPHPEGVAVSPSLRYLAWKAGLAKQERVLEGIADLEDAGWIRVLKRGSRDQNTPNTYVIRCARFGSKDNPPVVMLTPKTRNLLMMVRSNGRDSPGGERKVRRTDHTTGRTVTLVEELPRREAKVKGSIDKTGALALEKLLLAGEPLTRRDWAKRIGCRTNDLTRRYLPALVNAGLVIETQEDVFGLAHDLEDRLLDHLNATGAMAAHEGQRIALFTPDGDDPGELLGPERVAAAIKASVDKERELEAERAKVGTTPRTFIHAAMRDAPNGMHYPTLAAQWQARGGSTRYLGDAARRLKNAGELRWYRDLLGDWNIQSTARTEG